MREPAFIPTSVSHDAEPPKDWAIERKRQYFDWAKKVYSPGAVIQQIEATAQ
jgi:hypothetical protein